MEAPAYNSKWGNQLARKQEWHQRDRVQQYIDEVSLRTGEESRNLKMRVDEEQPEVDEVEPELVGATGCSRNLKSPSEVHSSRSHITSNNSNVGP